MHVNPKVLDNKDYAEKTNQNNHSKVDKASAGVFQKPLDMESAMGLYIIALIAGMSAAVIVGLMAVGIAFYTLKQKSKMAADVEYPAYGNDLNSFFMIEYFFS